MSSFTDYLEKGLLDHVSETASFSSPSVYLGLFTADPTESGDQTNEVGAADYAREGALAFDAASGTSPATIQNTNKIDFGQATNNWGTISHVGLMDAATGGNMLVHIELQNPQTINSGDTFQIAAGSLEVTLD